MRRIRLAVGGVQAGPLFDLGGQPAPGRLEATLGKPLFIRDHRGLHLTDVGDLFVAHARLILNQLEVLKTQVSAVVREAPADTALA